MYIHPWTVSNTHNVNILCKYIMYILTDYRLIWQTPQKTDPTSRQRGQTLVGLRWRGPAATVNYRPVFSSERALQNNKPQLSKRKSQGERKIGSGSQRGAWHQDGLTNWLSVVMWLWLWLYVAVSLSLIDSINQLFTFFTISNATLIIKTYSWKLCYTFLPTRSSSGNCSLAETAALYFLS
jgi:hypothetical protein